MSMEIAGKYGSSAPQYKDTEKADGVRISTVELKTPAPNVTRTAQIKTGFKNVNDYARYLRGRYSYMNSGKAMMSGVPTTVSVSGAFLAKCNKDPEKAKYLEENLAAIPDCVKSTAEYTKTLPGSPVCTYETFMIDDDGNISCMSGCTNDPDGKIARENAERKAAEKNKAKEKLEAKRREKTAEQKRAEEKRSKKAHRASASGNSVWHAAENIKTELTLTDFFDIAGGLDIKI